MWSHQCFNPVGVPLYHISNEQTERQTRQDLYLPTLNDQFYYYYKSRLLQNKDILVVKFQREGYKIEYQFRTLCFVIHIFWQLQLLKDFTYFIKWCPIFDGSALYLFTKYRMLIFAKNMFNFVNLSWKLDNWRNIKLNSNLGDNVLSLTFLITSIFERLYFLKLMPNFWWLGAISI